MGLRFPMFIDLTGKPAVVVGGGAVGLRRAAVLRGFGADVTVVAPEAQEMPEGVAMSAGPMPTAIWPGPSWRWPPPMTGR